MYWSCIRLESGYLYWLCSNSLGYCSLKSEQKAVIKNFINGKDVFAVLPTFLAIDRMDGRGHINTYSTSWTPIKEN